MREQSYKPNFIVIEESPSGERIIAGAEAITVARAAFDAAAGLSNYTVRLQHGARVIRAVAHPSKAEPEN